MCNKIKATIDKIDYDHILFSYHGIPISHLKISDPTNSHCYKVKNCCSIHSKAHEFCYKHQVIETTEAVINKLKIDKNKYSNAFQSRLPNEAWLKPYTDDELVRLAKEGKKRLVIVTPAFVTDCLETLEEIASVSQIGMIKNSDKFEKELGRVISEKLRDYHDSHKLASELQKMK